MGLWAPAPYASVPVGPQCNAKGGSKRQLLSSPASHSLFPVFGLVARSPSTTFFYPRALPRPVTESPHQILVAWHHPSIRTRSVYSRTVQRTIILLLFYCFWAPLPPRLPLLRGAQFWGLVFNFDTYYRNRIKKPSQETITCISAKMENLKGTTPGFNSIVDNTFK
ncbi:hypothetical protein KQX54_019296 [Cotesia glomerata]|uniref:Uncharacterized protein n=1 Tax=Cotesia glomerata TaxID=32391 RepID=A0AAV7I8A3_COTGL|nr:hypothetical protein KQX54_019296 [Cotesia glomerata]